MFEKAPVAGVEDSHGDMARYECKRRLAGHHRSATCVSYGRLELVSGHEDGEQTATIYRTMYTILSFVGEVFMLQ